MNCPTFLTLTPMERSKYIGMLIHAVQSDEELFILGQQLIDLATIKGLFDGVTIMPNNQAGVD